MADLFRLPARDDDGDIHVVVESPRGSRVKLKYEPALGVFTLARPLILGVQYPFDWGFVPSTRAPDGDPLDAIVLSEAPSYPGVVLACRAIGVVLVTQNAKEGGRERNDRLVTVAKKAPRTDGIEDARQLQERVREELAQFFLVAVSLAGKDVRIEGWDGPERAQQLIEEAIRNF
jgi:inorganic pyrophosphatase